MGKGCYPTLCHTPSHLGLDQVMIGVSMAYQVLQQCPPPASRGSHWLRTFGPGGCVHMYVCVSVPSSSPSPIPCFPHSTPGCLLVSFPHDANQPLNIDVCWSWFLTLLPTHPTNPATYGFILRIIQDAPRLHPLATDLEDQFLNPDIR